MFSFFRKKKRERLLAREARRIRLEAEIKAIESDLKALRGRNGSKMSKLDLMQEAILLVRLSDLKKQLEEVK
jgi:uncharacterized membrane protein